LFKPAEAEQNVMNVSDHRHRICFEVGVYTLFLRVLICHRPGSLYPSRSTKKSALYGCRP